MKKSEVQLISRSYGQLAPFFAEKLKVALEECNSCGYLVDMFEGYRSPERQDWLWEQGRERDGKIITNAKAWQSWHQYGLAVDIVGKVKGRWDWSIDYDKVTEIMNRHGFENLEFERPHFQMTAEMTWREAKKIHDSKGLYHLWRLVSGKMID